MLSIIYLSHFFLRDWFKSVLFDAMRCNQIFISFCQFSTSKVFLNMLYYNLKRHWKPKQTLSMMQGEERHKRRCQIMKKTNSVRYKDVGRIRKDNVNTWRGDPLALNWSSNYKQINYILSKCHIGCASTSRSLKSWRKF